MPLNYYESERREFVRVKTALPVKFKFISMTNQACPDAVLDGVTQNLSGGGFLLQGPIPDPAMVMPLLIQKIVVGVNIFLPGEEDPVKALTRVAWLEAPSPDSAGRCLMGLSFKEITKEHQDRVVRFIIKSQLAR